MGSEMCIRDRHSGDLAARNAAQRRKKGPGRAVHRWRHGRVARTGALKTQGAGKGGRLSVFTFTAPAQNLGRVIGRVSIQFPHALAPQCGWMREGWRGPWSSMGKPPDKADAALQGQPEGKASQAAHCVVALRLCSWAARRSGRLALHGLAGFRVGKLNDDTP